MQAPELAAKLQASGDIYPIIPAFSQSFYLLVELYTGREYLSNLWGRNPIYL